MTRKLKTAAAPPINSWPMAQFDQAMSGIAHPTAGEWVDARSLGMVLRVSERTLWRWRKAGLFKPGVHWRRKFPTSNSPVLYHLARCDAAMSEAAARTPQLLEID